MVQGVHHINFIVRNLAEAIPVWERILGRSVDSRDQLDGRVSISPGSISAARGSCSSNRPLPARRLTFSRPTVRGSS